MTRDRVGALGPGQPWTAARKREVVLRIFRGEPLKLLSQELGGRALAAGKVARRRPGGHGGGPQGPNGDRLKAELDNAMKRLGELTMENELLWVRMRRPSPLAKRRSKK